jgi:hypothetical protein
MKSSAGFLSGAADVGVDAGLLLAVFDVVAADALFQLELFEVRVDFGQIVLWLITDQLASIGDIEAFEAVVGEAVEDGEGWRT